MIIYKEKYIEEIPSLNSVDKIYKSLLETTPWVNREAPRDECFMALTDSITYTYGVGRGERTYKPSIMSFEVLSMMEKLNSDFGYKFNVCVLNYYKSEKEHLGWHADDSPEQDLTHPIAVISFGAEREIWTKKRGFSGQIPEKDKYLLTPGSLFVMPGGFQDDNLHKIPKPGKKCEGRISLTFRLIPHRPGPSIAGPND